VTRVVVKSPGNKDGGKNLCFTKRGAKRTLRKSLFISRGLYLNIKVKVYQSRYRPRVAQRVPGS
jgi:hypothetical protein